MKGSGGLLALLVLVAIIVVYYTQAGAPDTSGAGDAVGDVGGAIADKAPGPDEVIRGAGEGAEKAADGTAKVTNEAANYPLLLGAIALAMFGAYMWRKNKTLCIAILVAAGTVVVMSQR